MNFDTGSSFLEAFNQLNRLNEEYTPNNLDSTEAERESNKQAFYAAADKKLIDLDAFHLAFDKDFSELDLLSVFADNGKLAHRGTYGAMKNAPDQQHPAVKALKKLWGLQFADLAPTVAEQEQNKKAAEARKAAEAEAEENRKALGIELSDKLFELIDSKLWSDYAIASNNPKIEHPYLKINSISANGKWVATVYISNLYFRRTVSTLEDAADLINRSLPDLINKANEKTAAEKRATRRKTLAGNTFNGDCIYNDEKTYYIDDGNRFSTIPDNNLVDDIPESAELVATVSRQSDNNGNSVYADHWSIRYISYNKDKLTPEIEHYLGIKKPGKYDQVMAETEVTEESPDENNTNFYIDGMTNWLRVYHHVEATG